VAFEPADVRRFSAAAGAERRAAFGKAVVSAGCSDWSVPELVGVLLDARARPGSSTTQMLGVRKRGEAHLNGAKSEPTQPTIH